MFLTFLPLMMNKAMCWLNT